MLTTCLTEVSHWKKSYRELMMPKTYDISLEWIKYDLIWHLQKLIKTLEWEVNKTSSKNINNNLEDQSRWLNYIIMIRW